jgi:hypothetical protein
MIYLPPSCLTHNLTLNLDVKLFIVVQLYFIQNINTFSFCHFLGHNTKMGHDHLLELQLLKKSARHDFIIARHRSSNNIFSCQLLKSS